MSIDVSVTVSQNDFSVSFDGPPGAQGSKGDVGSGAGAVSIPYTFSSTTTSGNPGAGFLRLNNATENNATQVFLNSVDVNGADWTSVLSAMANAGTGVKGYIRLAKAADPKAFILFQVTSVAISAGWYNLAVTLFASNVASPFANGDSIVLYATPAMAAPAAGRNLVMNGDGAINQRAASSYANVNGVAYSFDRWVLRGTAAAKFTVALSTDVPLTSQTSSFLLTSSSAYALAASDYFEFVQPIEGVSAKSLQWGTANAQPLSKSFWIKVSVAGTYSGRVGNGVRTYPFTFALSANVWSFVTVTVPGDISGTWSSATGALGFFIAFSLGCGSSKQGTASAWNAADVAGVSGQVNLVSTAGATMRLAMIQAEVGAAATPFEQVPFADQLHRCKRFWESNFSYGAAPADSGRGMNATGVAYSSGQALTWIPFTVAKAKQPALAFYAGNTIASPTAGHWSYLTTSWSDGGATIAFAVDTTGTEVQVAGTYTAPGPVIFAGGWAANAELL